MSLADAMYYSQLAAQNNGVVSPEQIAARTYNQNSQLFGSSVQQAENNRQQNPLDLANYVSQQQPGFMNPSIYGLDVRGDQMRPMGASSPAFAVARQGSGAQSVFPNQSAPVSFGPIGGTPQGGNPPYNPNNGQLYNPYSAGHITPYSGGGNPYQNGVQAQQSYGQQNWMSMQPYQGQSYQSQWQPMQPQIGYMNQSRQGRKFGG